MMDDEEFDSRHYDPWFDDWDEREQPGYVCSFCGHVTCKGDCEYAYEAMWEDHENDSEFDDDLDDSQFI